MQFVNLSRQKFTPHNLLEITALNFWCKNQMQHQTVPDKMRSCTILVLQFLYSRHYLFDQVTRFQFWINQYKFYRISHYHHLRLTPRSTYNVYSIAVFNCSRCISYSLKISDDCPFIHIKFCYFSRKDSITTTANYENRWLSTDNCISKNA